jgi:hypothetical protein
MRVFCGSTSRNPGKLLETIEVLPNHTANQATASDHAISLKLSLTLSIALQ